MSEVIKVNNLSKSFGQHVAVDNISLSVNKSDIFGFLGPNGSGKTTTIRMLCGLLTPDSGTGTCLGYDIVKESSYIKKNVGYMPQYFSLYKDLTVLENLRFVAKLYKVKNEEENIKKILSDFDFGSRKSQLAANLSGGWKQKLMLAACLIHKPQLLLLDEPTAGIDPRARRDFWDIIYDLSSTGVTTLVSTHYMDEAQRCNKLAYISYSKLLVKGTEHDIMSSLNLYTVLVTGDIKFLALKLKGEASVDVVAFGRSLHISGTSKQQVEDVIRPYIDDKRFIFNHIESSIEDAFIHMVGKCNG